MSLLSRLLSFFEGRDEIHDVVRHDGWSGEKGHVSPHFSWVVDRTEKNAPKGLDMFNHSCTVDEQQGINPGRKST